MIEWRAEGIVLAVRAFGESSAIVEAFTRAQGRHAGVVKGGAGRRMGPVLQPGALLALTWRARLDAHLGTYTAEPVRGRAALLSDPLALSAMASVCALLAFALPEREAHPALLDVTLLLLDRLETDGGWPADYLNWEMRLLEETGFGLDLGTCAVTGATEGLAFVSPRTGHAVSRQGAGRWVDRLLPLPAALTGAGPADAADLLSGLDVTGHFLERSLAAALGDRPLPPARGRLMARMRRDLAGWTPRPQDGPAV